MKQYPIWNIITACIYKSAKSYGVRNTGEVEVRVGTSSRNSHKFLQHTTTHRLLDNGDREYRFYLDGECIKRALLKKGADELQTLEPKNHQTRSTPEGGASFFLPPFTFPHVGLQRCKDSQTHLCKIDATTRFAHPKQSSKLPKVKSASASGDTERDARCLDARNSQSLPPSNKYRTDLEDARTKKKET